jgi:hypothetical protein
LHAAGTEYVKKQQAGETISLDTAFAYVTEGRRLKTKCDTEIYAILQKFESELQDNSFPLDKAKLCRQEYELRKSEFQKRFLTLSPI